MIKLFISLILLCPFAFLHAQDSGTLKIHTYKEELKYKGNKLISRDTIALSSVYIRVYKMHDTGTSKDNDTIYIMDGTSDNNGNIQFSIKDRRVEIIGSKKGFNPSIEYGIPITPGTTKFIKLDMPNDVGPGIVY